MAGSYPNIPADRIPYDINNISVLYFQNSIWTALTSAQKTAINKESESQSLLIQGNQITFISFVFPVFYDIAAVFSSAFDGFDFSGVVFISTDTTNGIDGNWTVAMASLYTPSDRIYWNTIPNYRTGIVNISSASGIKGIRFGTTSSTRVNLKSLHLYGNESDASERLEFWKSDNSAELSPYEWDFGDVAEGSSSIKNFKIKNYLEDDISQMSLSIQIPTDLSPSIQSDYLLSTDQLAWSNIATIPSTTGQTIAKNGGTSETLYLKQTNPNTSSSGLFTGRAITSVYKYNRPYWTVNGFSSYITYKQKFTDQLEIIPSQGGLGGNAWYSQTLSLPVSLSFSYNVSASSGTFGGDGFAIGFMDKDNSLSMIGAGGGGYGFSAPGGGYPTNRVVGIAFDCYQNSGDRSVPYIATFDSHAGNYSPNPWVVQSNTTGLTTSDIDGTHTVQLDISTAGTTLYLDGVSKWTSTDFHKNLPSEFYVGFGSGTGGVRARWTTTGTALTYGTTPDPEPSQVTSGALLNFDFANPACCSGSGTTKNFVSAKIYSVYGGGLRSSNYTVQYSDDNINWTTAFSGVASNNTSCGIQQNTGSGNGLYGAHTYWRYVEGSAIASHHPRVSRIILTDINGVDYDLVTYVPDNCSDSGQYIIGTVSLNLSITINDLSGNNNNGTISGGVSYSNQYGGVLNFDGNLSHVILPSGFSNFTSGFSISFFANFGSTNGDYERIIDFSNGQASDNIVVCRDTTSNSLLSGFFIGPSFPAANYINDSKGFLVNTQMSHYAFVANGSIYSVYKNGVLVATKAGTVLPNNITRAQCYIGKQPWPNTPYFEGSIGTIKVFNRALSAEEVYQDFSAVRSRYNI